MKLGKALVWFGICLVTVPLLMAASDHVLRISNNENSTSLAVTTDHALIQSGIATAAATSEYTVITFSDTYSASTYSFTFNPAGVVATAGDGCTLDSIFIHSVTTAACSLVTDSTTASIHWQAIGWDSD